MSKLKYITKGDSSLRGVQKVYFCGHPKDYDIYLEVIASDIFKTHNCAYFYDIEPEVPYDKEELLFSISQMALIVTPITATFLEDGSRARDVELQYAQENNIPILFIAQESGLELEFNRLFGNLQFLDKSLNDPTVISYEEKLKNYLNIILVGDELSKKVRATFIAYIFLSYRKKDRKYAQELMKIIHKNEFCYDIAIWYDEFLNPGENFEETIFNAINNSALFVLTVTPNLVNESNYILTKEYPEAKRLDKKILPIETISTNICELQAKYLGIKVVIKSSNEQDITEVLKQLHEEINNQIQMRTEDNLLHVYYIGVAYYAGIDVEIDYTLALRLFEESANDGLYESAEMLVNMYLNGIGVNMDIDKAIEWKRKSIDIIKDKFSKDDSFYGDYLSNELELAKIELNNDRLKDCRNSCWRVIKMCRTQEGFGEYVRCESKRIYADAYLILAQMFIARGDRQQGKECLEKASKVYDEILIDTPNDYELLNNKILCELLIGDIIFIQGCIYDSAKKHYKKSLELFQQILKLSYSQEVYRNIAICYLRISDFILRYESSTEIDSTTELLKESIEIALKLYNEEQSLNNITLLANAYCENGDLLNRTYMDSEQEYLEALKLYTDVYKKFNLNSTAKELCKLKIKLSKIYKSKNNIDKCQSFADEALELGKRIADESVLLNSYDKYHNDSQFIMSQCLMSKYDSSVSNKQYYGKEAFRILYELFKSDPHQLFIEDHYQYWIYFSDIKKQLWMDGVIDETDLPMVKLDVVYDDQDRYLLQNDKSTAFRIVINFVGCKPPRGKITSLLCYENTMIELTKTPKLLQLGEIDDLCTRTLPDEFIELVISDDNDRQMKIKYKRMYG